MATEFKKIMPRFVNLGDYSAQSTAQRIYKQPFQNWHCSLVMPIKQSVYSTIC
ncbi:hypothetical protein ACOBWA_05915 [Psychrobacter sp. ER1]|uniref:hypothetical protein n=1 Tax=Psychrobacter sp. ER1 TaxID=3406645 RepID=UPI003B42E302